MELERREHHEDTKNPTKPYIAEKAACDCLRPRLCGHASPLPCGTGQLLQQSHPKESRMGIRGCVRRRRHYRNKYAHRTEFKRLIADCNAGKIALVLVKSISRFARDTVDCLHTVRRLKEKGSAVRFERENIGSTSEDGELLLTLLASFAQEESRSIISFL